ncbi:hypothetical protein PG994_006032 [Apiospora phragmitis]|uniref:Uncharacterized protein n=1 Tax=Apiospora phragmitis TaxID=2905665 RepID=A0ABR1VDX4_9PEZI
MSYSLSGLQAWDLWQGLQPHIIDLIYSSNFIEQAGSTHAITAEVCEKIFAGQEISATVSGDEYTRSEEALKSLGRPHSAEDVRKSRQEVINHAHALLYAFDHFVLSKKGFKAPAFEDLIKQIHVLLCGGNVLDPDEAGSPGQYRTWLVGARNGNQKKPALFIRPAAVPEYMQKMAMDMKLDLCMPLLDEDLPCGGAGRYVLLSLCLYPPLRRRKWQDLQDHTQHVSAQDRRPAQHLWRQRGGKKRISPDRVSRKQDVLRGRR